MNVLRRDLTIELMVEYYHYAKNEWKMICNAGIHEKEWWQWKKIKLWRKIVQDDIPSFSTLKPHYFEGCSVTRTLISKQHGDYMKNCNNLRTRSRVHDRICVLQSERTSTCAPEVNHVTMGHDLMWPAALKNETWRGHLQKVYDNTGIILEKKSELEVNADLILNIEHFYQQCYYNPNAEIVEQKTMRIRFLQIWVI